jgi:hypothetical protein
MNHLLNVMAVASCILLVAVLVSLRRSHIRVEYSVSWLAAAVALLVLSRSHTILLWITNVLGVNDPPVTLIMIVFCVFLVVFFRFSVIISDLKDANVAMAQRVAILEYQVESLNHEGQQALEERKSGAFGSSS